jgi:hypothetical protein
VRKRRRCACKGIDLVTYTTRGNLDQLREFIVQPLAVLEEVVLVPLVEPVPISSGRCIILFYTAIPESFVAT